VKHIRAGLFGGLGCIIGGVLIQVLGDILWPTLALAMAVTIALAIIDWVTEKEK
jgi:hypothetical protein